MRERQKLCAERRGVGFESMAARNLFCLSIHRREDQTRFGVALILQSISLATISAPLPQVKHALTSFAQPLAGIWSFAPSVAQGLLTLPMTATSLPRCLTFNADKSVETTDDMLTDWTEGKSPTS
jgi:hypothetical protein